MFFMLKQQYLPEEMSGYGRDKFFELLRENQWLNKRERRRRQPGTDSRKTELIYPNLKATTRIERPNQVLESDITAIKIKGSYKALAIVIDVYSRKIVGWNLSPNWTAEEVLKPLAEAAGQDGRHLAGSIHHSDRGAQYGSRLYAGITKSLGMINSMSRKGTPTDEAHIERVNRTLKREFNLRREFGGFDDAYEAIYIAVMIYNEIRPHWSLNLKTPSQVYAEEGL